VASGDAHTRDSIRSMLCVFETRAFEIYATLPAGPRRYLPDDTSIRKFDSHSRDRGAGEHNTDD